MLRDLKRHIKLHAMYFSSAMLLLGCVTTPKSHTEVIKTYYKGFNASNFDIIQTVISDSLLIKEGDYLSHFTANSFYEFFKWDSIFQPSYTLKTIEVLDDGIEVTVASRALRYEFLKNNPLTCKFKFHFKSNKINYIETLDCLDADWNVWARERDTLVKWTAKHHPELDGFIHDLSMSGALKYVKAISLYSNRVQTHP